VNQQPFMVAGICHGILFIAPPQNLSDAHGCLFCA
jgi:hypothetical protein